MWDLAALFLESEFTSAEERRLLVITRAQDSSFKGETVFTKSCRYHLESGLFTKKKMVQMGDYGTRYNRAVKELESEGDLNEN